MQVKDIEMKTLNQEDNVVDNGSALEQQGQNVVELNPLAELLRAQEGQVNRLFDDSFVPPASEILANDVKEEVKKEEEKKEEEKQVQVDVVEEKPANPTDATNTSSTTNTTEEEQQPTAEEQQVAKDAKKLADHVLAQEKLKDSLVEREEAIEADYKTNGTALRESLKGFLKNRMDNAPGKLALLLVDVQVDFVYGPFREYKQAALYAPGGENTVLSNMALLDALAELIEEDKSAAKRFEIITSQDAHIFKRAANCPDAALMAQEVAYGEEDTKRTVTVEATELEDINPKEGKFGLHCLRGTVGADIAGPIKARLAKMSKADEDKKVVVTAFGKINFSGPEAGMLLAEGVDLSDAKFLEQGADLNIYDKKAVSYKNYITGQKFGQILTTGICGDVCVQQAVEGLAKLDQNVAVIDPCVHYLVFPGMDYKKVKGDVVASYKDTEKHKDEKYKISNVDFNNPAFRSNPDLVTEAEKNAYVQSVQARNFLVQSKLNVRLALVDKLQKELDGNPEKKDSTEAQTIRSLNINLKDLVKSFTAIDSNFDLAARKQDFKDKSLKAIALAQKQLPENTSLLAYLAKLASFIVTVCGVGLPLLAGKGIFGLFSVKTAEQMKLEEVEAGIEKALPTMGA